MFGLPARLHILAGHFKNYKINSKNVPIVLKFGKVEVLTQALMLLKITGSNLIYKLFELIPISLFHAQTQIRFSSK